MPLSRLSFLIAGGVLLSGLVFGVPAQAQKSDKMVAQGDMSDTVKPYYDFYERNHDYIRDSRDHRQRMDERRTTYVAPLIARRAAGMNARGDGAGVFVAEGAYLGASGPGMASAESKPVDSDPAPVQTKAGESSDSMLSESAVRAFVKDAKDKVVAATQEGDIKALDALLRAVCAPSYVLTLQTESFIDGKEEGHATINLTLEQAVQANQGLLAMSDVSMTYEILSIAIKKDEAIVNDISTTRANVNLPGAGPATSESKSTCTDTIRKQPDGKLAYTKSVCKSRSSLNRERPI